MNDVLCICKMLDLSAEDCVQLCFEGVKYSCIIWCGILVVFPRFLKKPNKIMMPHLYLNFKLIFSCKIKYKMY